MRLLDRTEIEKITSSEKKRQIDEGVRIASKVDALRQMAGTEEANLLRFRDETTSRIKKEIEVLDRQKSTLTLEITDLQAEKARLQVPLDAAWNELKRDREIFDTEYAHFLGFVRDLHSDQKQLEKDKKKLALAVRKSEVKKAEAEDNLSKSERILKDAEQTARDIQAKSEKIEEKLEERQKAVRDKEANVLVRERDIGLKMKKIETDEKALIERERLINDKYRSLLKAQEEYENITKRRK